MSDKKKYRMLKLLDGMIAGCTKCPLYQNGRATPYWFKNENGDVPSYVIVGEAPGSNEVENNEPFVGKAGQILWRIMDQYGFKKEQFLIINSVNCRPVNGNKNGKPSPDQIIRCREWVNLYINTLMPLRGILLGSYAQQSIMNENIDSVIQNNTSITLYQTNNMNTPLIPMVRSVHPAFSIYSPEGESLLENSVKKFKLM